jgi:hypothetical protein
VCISSWKLQERYSSVGVRVLLCTVMCYLQWSLFFLWLQQTRQWIHINIGLQWFSQLDRRKKMQNHILKMFFNWFSHFLRICILLVPNNTLYICIPWPQIFVSDFFAYACSKYLEFNADFKSAEIVGKKKIRKKLVGTNSNFAHFFAYNFFVSKFLATVPKSA